MNIGELLTITSSFLKEKNCSRSRRVAEELIGFVLQLKRLDLYMHFDRPVMESELEVLRPLLKRAVKGEPVEYITGKLSFSRCSLTVTKDVLIPRPETEILVEMACRQILRENLVVWDICTGSGCIGLAVKKAFPQFRVTLSDVSAKALEIAAINAKKNGVDVELLQGDLLIPFLGRKADVIFCNPPYISAKDFLSLDRSVRDFEPEWALVGGEDGVQFYRRLRDELPAYLNASAKIFFEIGFNQGESLLKLFSNSHWKNVRVEKDWAGHDRFFFLEFE